MSESTLIIVSGPPCSGKTTIGRAIARACHLPFFSKDDIKELLFDQLGWSDRAWSMKLGIGSTVLLYDIAAKMLEVGASVVIENAFHKDPAVSRFLELQKTYGCDLLQIHFRANNEVIVERFQKRAGNDRHPGHADATLIDDLSRRLESGTYDMRIPGAQYIMVDTDDWGDVDTEKICSDVYRLLGKEPLNPT